VFYNPKTSRPYPDVRKSFKAALKKAKIKDFHFHDQRHTRGSMLAMEGVDVLSIKELLTHSRLTTTQKYMHLSPEHKRRATNRVQIAV
jgi:site-specific recombinase XerD